MFSSFWKNGKWVEIVIDDRLPTINRKLKYSSGQQKNEFWVPLIEKAYAKFYGSYKALKGGEGGEAMVDLTGGIIERYELDKAPKELFSMIQRSLKNGSSVTSTVQRSELLNGIIKLVGLVNYHVFTVSAVESVIDDSFQQFDLIKLRNPFGNKLEWNGIFSDESSKWEKILFKNGLKKKQEDGEFFMAFSDFVGHFDVIEFCHVSPNMYSSPLDITEKKWNTVLHNGQWLAGVNYKPYLIQLDEFGEYTMIVTLMQKNRRNKNTMPFPIWIDVLCVAPLNSNTLCCTRFDQMPQMKDLRDATEYFDKLPSGCYLIVPRTITRESEEFLLRIYTRKKEVEKHGSDFQYL
jgi:calpain, invertebrate